MMMMMMKNCFCGIVNRRKTFSLISSRDHCQRSPPSQISDTPRAGFEPALSLSSRLIEWSCAVVITTTPRRHVTTPRHHSWLWVYCRFNSYFTFIEKEKLHFSLICSYYCCLVKKCWVDSCLTICHLRASCLSTGCI